jgi:hypothetical protein
MPRSVVLEYGELGRVPLAHVTRIVVKPANNSKFLDMSIYYSTYFAIDKSVD